VTTPAPTFLAVPEATRVLEKALAAPSIAVTVADAAAKSGLALRDAERGLTALVSEYRGHLRVSDEGDLVYVFPAGFTKPWEAGDAVRSGLRKVKRAAAGVARFVVRAWLTIAIFAYVATFLAVLLGLTLAKQGDRDDLPGASLFGALFRVLADALFWTFHPFSPLAIEPYGAGYARARRPRDETPFYEKVNRFVFGPPPPAEDPRESERRIVAEIRAKKGRVGLADVMRVTGLSRTQADGIMARLMLDYDGGRERVRSGRHRVPLPGPSKDRRRRPLPTRPRARVGPPRGRAPAHGQRRWCELPHRRAERVQPRHGGLRALGEPHARAHLQHLEMVRHPELDIAPLGYDGVPIVLGLVPLVMSLAVFVLPVVRALGRPLAERAVAKENGRRALLREVLEATRKGEGVSASRLRAAWSRASGGPVDDAELTRVVVELGGDVDLEAAEKVRVADPSADPVRYRFAELELEAEAVDEERAFAKESERKVGKVVFTSED
jgi:hypothetical protein